MVFEIDGKEYFTEEKTVTFTRVYTYNDKGQKMTCSFNDLPLLPSLTEVVLAMKSRGAKVVE